MSNNDFKIFDEYHSICRDSVLTLQACNEQFSTNFPITSNSNSAWKEYSNDFDELILSENVIDGEWLTTKMSSQVS